MKSAHPASLILLAAAFLLASGSRSGSGLFLVFAGASLCALWAARRQFLLILHRSRWLLLTMLVLFGWMTPGTSVDWLPGASLEGLQLAAEYLARIGLAMAAVAGLLTAMSPLALVAGLHGLLAPLARFGDFRDRLAVRLMLTLEEIDVAGSSTLSGDVRALSLVRRSPGIADALLGLASSALLAVAVLA